MTSPGLGWRKVTESQKNTKQICRWYFISYLTQASIILLLEKDKDPTSCSSYRPLSLLNVDIKLLAKLQASRLERVFPSITSEEQHGFTEGRHTFLILAHFLISCTLRAMLNFLRFSSPLMLRKHRVKWEYLLAVLRKFGSGDKFVSWIHLFYTSPHASEHTNDLSL